MRRDAGYNSSDGRKRPAAAPSSPAAAAAAVAAPLGGGAHVLPHDVTHMGGSDPHVMGHVSGHAHPPDVPHVGVWQTLRDIIDEDGPLAMWRGLDPAFFFSAAGPGYVAKLATDLHLLGTLERDKNDELKGVKALKRDLTPRLVKDVEKATSEE